MLYGELYQMWEGRKKPTATTARMVRTTLKYLASAVNGHGWDNLPVVSEQYALVLLDGVMSKTKLGSQSRSNYRNYLRRLYRFTSEEGIDLGSGGRQIWAPAPNHDSVPRRAQVAYERFVRWAIGQGIWPDTVTSQHLLDWALVEKEDSNLHWRKDYDRLKMVWDNLVASGNLSAIKALPLPAKLNKKYALPVEQWPSHLREEWQRMCRAAAAPLRKGGMRPWRPITQEHYQRQLTLFLGWLILEQPSIQLTSEAWNTLLSVDRCQDYLNWLVARAGKNYLNPGHTAFLRMVRGFHRFLLNSEHEVIQSFTDLCKRCEVEERDKAVRIAPFPVVHRGFHKIFAATMDLMKNSRRTAKDDSRLATMQVDTIIIGILTTRALRCANIIGMKVDKNIVKTADGFELRYESKEMKGHRKFETSLPDELVPIMEDYLAHGYRVLTGRHPSADDRLLINRRGKPLGGHSLGQRVRQLTRKYVGKQLHPHLFRHIVATHAAQVWKMTPTELAAFLAHKSVMTVMKYYEVTNPARAAERFDAFRTTQMA